MSKQSHILDDAHDLWSVAATYVEDGAFLTAADRLEQAAKLLRQHAQNTRHD